MKLFKKFLIKLLFPHIAVIIFIVSVVLIMLIYSFIRPDSHPLLIYASVFLSSYVLAILFIKQPVVLNKIKPIK